MRGAAVGSDGHLGGQLAETQDERALSVFDRRREVEQRRRLAEEAVGQRACLWRDAIQD